MIGAVRHLINPQPPPNEDAQMFNPESPPELMVSRWLNTKAPLSLAALKGRVVMLASFQMLCPGSINHGLPQAKKFAERFDSNEVAVIGLHTVFEHHDVMNDKALEAFATEFRWPFPIAIDAADGKDMPKTMQAYEMQGTPSILLFDRQGRLRRHYLGQVDDIRLAAEIMALAIEDAKAPREASVAIERALQAALVDPDEHHHAHDHEGGCCGGHDHDHDHHHGHHHDHGGGCCGGHDHDHDHDHAHAATAVGGAKASGKTGGKEGCDGKGGCGCH